MTERIGQEPAVLWLEARRRRRLRLALALAACGALFLFSLCVRYNAGAYPDAAWFIPGRYAQSLLLAARQVLGRLTGRAAALSLTTEEAVIYRGALARLRLTAMAFTAGAGLAVAGAVFQTAYRSPVASPSILGATAGVSLGNVLMVTLYSASAVNLVLLRCRLCYALAAVCVLVVLGLGRLGGARGGDGFPAEMVMAGAVVSQVLRVGVLYLMYQLEDEDMLVYQRLVLGMDLETDAASTALFFGVMLLSLAPVLAAGYRMNALSMGELEAASLGLAAGPVRLVGQVCGVLMAACVTIHCGEIGLVSLVVPCLVRRAAGGEFRAVCVYSALGGGAVVMVCRLLTSFFYVLDQPLPITIFVDLLLTPLFLAALGRYRGDFF